MSAPLLEVARLSVFADGSSGRRTLVKEVDLTVRAGETLGVVGESGSGKSMLVKAVLALLPHNVSSTGEVTFDGQRIDALDERAMRRLRGRRLSLLLQDPFTMLNPVQTVGATIAETLREDRRRSRAELKTEVARRLTEVGLDPLVAGKRPFQLSGGMLQRVAIAAALAGDPDLLIADEPTTALDVSTQDEVLRLLSSLRASRRMGLVLITHDLRVAFDVCDQVMVLYAGEVMEHAPATVVRATPLHPYTSRLMAAEPSVDRWTRDLHVLPGSVPDPDSVQDQCAFAARCDWAQDGCTSGVPALALVADGHLSRCRRVHDIGAELVRLVEEPVIDTRPSLPGAPVADGLLEIQGLTKTYHSASLVGRRESHQALRGVDLYIGQGEAVGLVGESGSGKTTIARSILGLSTPSGGRITLAGTDISDFATLSRKDSRKVRRLVQPVFQNPYASLNPSLTIGRALSEAVQARGGTGDIKAQVAEALRRVNLPEDYAGRLPAGLSGGERQRVSIARAVCLAPRLLICDEPVAALDVSVQAQVLELLRSLREELGMAMLFITHDLAVVRQMTERVLVLDRGVVVEHGCTDDVLDDPQHSYTRQLIAAIPGHRSSHPTPVPCSDTHGAVDPAPVPPPERKSDERHADRSV
ncbi:dipeptide ABC transporter ATP-binding protein [Nocardioides sp.]|uniref:dipeptide ABC transporter ATP-binding protein n=1 Tax=Nocardioides sp. TaxID=35761 RepID=UPI003D13B492